MSEKKSLQPLLYIHQPVFEKQTAPMQQFFMTKKPKERETQLYENITNDVKEVGQEEIMPNLTTVQEVEIPKFEFSLEEENVEPNVMEFMLESILTPRFEPDIEVVKIPTKVPLESVKKANSEAKVNSSINTTRTPFNQLSLVNKLNRLKKMPAEVVKFLYEFKTKENDIRGYFISSKESELTILPVNSLEKIQIQEASIVDIKTIGF